MHHIDIWKESLEEKKMPLVSVIMPCYNHGAYVGGAIESILNQTYPNIELIVADNGCTDNSYEVMNRYQDRIKIIRLEKNDRRWCLRMLLEAVTGEYVAQATADDEWMPEKIQLQMEAFFSIPNLQVCFTWALEADENMQVRAGQEKNAFLAKNRSRGEWLWFFFHRGNCLCLPSALYRVSVAEYFAQIARGYAQLGDFYQWVSILQHGEIYVVEKPMVKFRWHTSGNNANESAPSIGTAIRSGLEYVDITLQIAEDTEDKLFLEAFGGEFVNPNARTHKELLCERFFLLKRRAEEAPAFSTAMFRFYYSHYDEMERMLQSQYGFSFDDYRELAENTGVTHMKVMLDLASATNKIQGDSLYAYRRLAQKLVKECCPEGIDKRIVGVIFALMPETEQTDVRRLREVCGAVLDWVARHGSLLGVMHFEFMELITGAWQIMDNMREQLRLLGILQDDEEFELFGQLVHFAQTEKIDLQEAVVPYIEMMAGQLDGIVN